MKLRTAAAALAASLPLAADLHAQDPAALTTPLNHFYVVIPKDAYDAIRASEFMTKVFAPFEARTTVRNDQTYTGIYFYGRRTYFEFFEPDAQGPVGASGIALGTDTPGHLAPLEIAWKKALGGAQRGPVTRKTETGEAPWFEMLAGQGQGPGLRLWFMEYHPAFLKDWYPALTPARGVTRAEILDRYVAKIGGTAGRSRTRFGDVTSMTLVLDPMDRSALLGHLRASGWAVTEGGEGRAEAVGPDSVRILVDAEVEPKKGPRGIVGVTFALSQSGPQVTHRFGSSVSLSLDGAQAVLRTDSRP